MNRYYDELPTSIEIDGQTFKIRDNCDFRIVKKCIRILNDSDLELQNRIQCALVTFYEDFDKLVDIETAVKEMYYIINNGDDEDGESQKQEPPIMDWDYDWKLIAPAINHILGYDVRTPGKYTHWWTLLGAYMEIKEGMFVDVISTRRKIRKGKMDKDDRAFYAKNKALVDLPVHEQKTPIYEENDDILMKIAREKGTLKE